MLPSRIVLMCLRSAINVEQLTTSGRSQIRQYILDHSEVSYSLGFALEDVRVSDISFPKSRGIIRQVEGLSAREEAEHDAALKMQIAAAGRPEVQPAPVQQVNIVSGNDPNSNNPSLGATLEATTVAMTGQPTLANLPPVKDTPGLAPTRLATDEGTARLVHRLTGAIVFLSVTPFTIGREPSSTLVLEDALCSRNHALIVYFNDTQGKMQYQLTDLSSSNGTFVGGQKLAPNQQFWLTPGNIIRIGTQEWTFEV